MTSQAQNERIRQGWESRRGEPLVIMPISEPIFEGHPRVARAYSRSIILFAFRVFVNEEAEYYETANRYLLENFRFYIENTDVRDDRDSFYWNVSEACRMVRYFASDGSRAPGRMAPETEAAFYEMAFGYCHDMSKLHDAEWENGATWRVYESENHHVQRNSAIWQMMQLLLKKPGMADAVMGDGYTMQAHFDMWTAFFKEWMKERARGGMFVEVQSRVYGIHTLKNIIPMYDFAPDEEMRTLTDHFICLFWALWAQEQINGCAGGGQSRMYPASARTTTGETRNWVWYYTGIGQMEKPNEMEYICLDSSWRMPEMLVKMICGHTERGVYETWMRSPGYALPENRFPNYRPDPEWSRINRYSYCTPDFIMGTQMYRQYPTDHWCLISSQNRYQGVVFGVEDAQILPIPQPRSMHTLQSTEASLTYNAFWAMQKKGTLITQKNHLCTDAGDMRVWLSQAGGVDQIIEKDGVVFTACGNALSAIRVARGGYDIRSAGKNGEIYCEKEGKFLVCRDDFSPVILETVRMCDYGSMEAFMEAVLARDVEWNEGVMTYTSLYGDEFVMDAEKDGVATINGAEFVQKIPFSFSSPYAEMPWKGQEAVIRYQGEEMKLDFT